jgi:hypothetical protein
MTRAAFTAAELARAIKAADQAGKVAVLTRGGIVFAPPDKVALPSPETGRANSCDEIFGTGSSP